MVVVEILVGQNQVDIDVAEARWLFAKFINE
jgi:hypothetical protein